MRDEASARSGIAPESPAPSGLTFSLKINFILGLGLAILAAVGLLSYRSINTLVETGRLEGAVIANLGRIEMVLGSLRQAEATQRRFLITNRSSDLDAYRRASARVGAEIDTMRAELSDPDQKRRLKKLESIAAERLLRLDRGVEVMTSLGPKASAELVMSASADELNRSIEMLAEQFRQDELRSLRTRRADTAFSAETASFLILWGSVFAVTLIVWAMVVIRRHQLARRAAVQALRSSEAQLRLITDAVPALIGYVDREGRLRFHNRAFERWFGRGSEAFRGRAFLDLLGEGNYPVIEPRVSEVLQGHPAAFDFSLTRNGKPPMNLSAQLVPKRDERGGVEGYYALVTDITALKEVERLKSEFVTTVSHELRTPLTSIRGTLGLLAGGVTGAIPEKARELVLIARDNCERLVRLVNDILDSEKMLSGSMQFAQESVDIEALVERVIRENEGFASGLGVRIRFTPAARKTEVRADPDRMAQVLTNLLSNACKFSPRLGEVEVNVEVLDAAMRVAVSDRGPGIPQEHRDRLFERFFQVDASRLRRTGGTGLGLHICKGIVEKLGGRIGFLPREGGGSIFFFELPMQAAKAAAHD